MDIPVATLHDVIATLDRRAQQPAILAMQTEGMDEWTFARLADHSGRLAAGLRQSGLEPGARAALVAPNRPEWIVTCLALIKAGGATVLIDAGDDQPRSWRRLLADEPFESEGVDPEDMAVAFYTSSKSGAAKGVPLSHRNLASNIQVLKSMDLVAPNDRPPVQRFLDPITIAVGVAALIALQTHVKFERTKDGKILFKIEKKPLPLDLMRKLLTFFSQK